MTDRLYYPDSFLYKFDAEVQEVQETPRAAVVLDRTAFYPTSGGQIHDTGYLGLGDPSMDTARFRVTEVADREDGHIVHYLEAPLKDIEPGTRIRGEIDIARRRDHMQQHSAQHVLSAAFIRLFDIATVSFHMADDYCSIDLDTPALTRNQVEAAERLANEIVLENRPVEIRYTTREEAVHLGLRKPPAEGREQLRLIDIRDWDLSACGGTHVAQTGQIAGLLLRKFEKVRQGWRVEFVAGQRAVSTARRDFAALTEAGTLFSAQIHDVPQQARKALEEIRGLRKQLEQVHEDLAAAEAAGCLAETPETHGRRLIVRTFSGRDLSFLKLLAHKITRQPLPAVALLGADSPQPALVFAQSAGQPHDMAALLKQTVMWLGRRGGGSKDLAQGGIPRAGDLAAALASAAQSLASTTA